jgi:hypothetical protein
VQSGESKDRQTKRKKVCLCIKASDVAVHTPIGDVTTALATCPTGQQSVRERETESCLSDTEKRISSDEVLWSFTVEMWAAFR